MNSQKRLLSEIAQVKALYQDMDAIVKKIEAEPVVPAYLPAKMVAAQPQVYDLRLREARTERSRLAKEWKQLVEEYKASN